MSAREDDGVTIDAENPPVEFDPRGARTRGKKFDPFSKFRKLSGRSEYLDVKWRLIWLRSEFPEALIETKCLTHDYGSKVKAENMATFWARVTLPDGQGCAEAHGSETQSDFGDYYEKAETKAVGRALEYLGYGTTSAKEDQEALADAPFEDRRRDDRERDSHSRRERDNRDDRDRDRGRDRDDLRDRDRGRERDRPRRDSRDFADDEEEPPARRARERERERERDPEPVRAARKPAPPVDDDDDEIETDIAKVFGFPPAKVGQEEYTTLPQVQKAMDEMPGEDAMARHDGRKRIYQAILKARWSTAAVGEVKGFWTAANERDEREDAAGKVLDDEDDV